MCHLQVLISLSSVNQPSSGWELMAGSKVLIEYYHAVDDEEEVPNESQKEQGTSQQVH